MKIKKNDDFNNNLLKVFNLLSISGHYNIVGSASLKKIYYNSDIDLNEQDNFKSFSSVYNKFRNIFKLAKENENLFITDFKCGLDNKHEPLRWSYENILKSAIGNKTFEDCLKEKSMIKLDMIYLLNGSFIEITEVYFIRIGKYQNYDNNELNENIIKENLQKEFNEFVKDGLYFKALKRLFSILQLKKNISKNVFNKFINFFNSETGILYKTNADLNILISVIENTFRKPNIEDIKNNLQIIKQNLAIQTETHKNCSVIIDDICKLNKLNEMAIYIHKLSDYLSRVYNRNAKAFLENK